MNFAARRDQSVIMLSILGWTLFISIFVFLMIMQDQLQFTIIISVVLIIHVVNAIYKISNIHYEFDDVWLYLRSGFYKSTIYYEDIQYVERYNHFPFMGYNLAMAKEGLVIYYKRGIYSSVKISPEDIEGFIQELEKRDIEVR